MRWEQLLLSREINERPCRLSSLLLFQQYSVRRHVIRPRTVAPVVHLVTSKPSDVYTKFDFTVDEGKGRLDPSHDKD